MMGQNGTSRAAWQCSSLKLELLICHGNTGRSPPRNFGRKLFHIFPICLSTKELFLPAIFSSGSSVISPNETLKLLQLISPPLEGISKYKGTLEYELQNEMIRFQLLIFFSFLMVVLVLRVFLVRESSVAGGFVISFTAQGKNIHSQVLPVIFFYLFI